MKISPLIFIPIIGIYYFLKYDNFKHIEFLGQINLYMFYQLFSIITILKFI